MNDKRVEVKFWNSFNECICFGFKTSIDFKDMKSAKNYVNNTTIKDAKQVTFTEFIGNKIINSECYDIEEE